MFNLVGKALAQNPGVGSLNLSFLNPTVGMENVVNRIITWVLFVAGAIAVIYLVYGGILYITAGGDAEKATKGRTAVVNAVIGIIIILLAYVIVQFVANVVTTNR